MSVAAIIGLMRFAHSDEVVTASIGDHRFVAEPGIEILIKIGDAQPIAARLESGTFVSGFGVVGVSELTELRTIVQAVTVRRDGELMPVNYAAYAGFANLNTIRLSKSQDQVVVSFDGGQTGEHYLATLTFRNGVLVKRRVVSAEMPDDSWEETVYSSIMDTCPDC